MPDTQLVQILHALANLSRDAYLLEPWEQSPTASGLPLFVNSDSFPPSPILFRPLAPPRFLSRSAVGHAITAVVAAAIIICNVLIALARAALAPARSCTICLCALLLELTTAAFAFAVSAPLMHLRCRPLLLP